MSAVEIVGAQADPAARSRQFLFGCQGGFAGDLCSQADGKHLLPGAVTSLVRVFHGSQPFSSADHQEKT